MSNPKKHQKGAIAVLAAILMVTLIAFLGLAVDSGYMFVKRNELQNVADAVALACLIENDPTKACGDGTVANAKSDIDVTWFSDIMPIIVPTIPSANPDRYAVHATYPILLPSALCPSPASKCAQASASTHFTPFFMSMFGYSNIQLSAAAVAANTGMADCLDVQAVLSMNGTPIINGPNCNVRMGQSHDVGNSQIIAAHNYIYNGYPPSDCSACSPPAISEAGPVPVPSLLPNPPSFSTANSQQVSPITKQNPLGNQCPTKGTCNLSQGYYQYGIDCSAAQAVCNFSQGQYNLDGPLNLASNNGQSSGTGVLFYMNGVGINGAIAINAGAAASLTGYKTSTGTCAATNNQLLFYSLKTSTFSLGGNTGSSILGNIYLPSYEMDWNGGNNMTVGGSIVVNSFVKTNGNNTLTIDPTLISCNLSGGGSISLIN